jgi:hypothetical protein
MARMNREREENRRQQVERLLASDLTVDEWCKRNRIAASTMYRWCLALTEAEPEIFGGAENIVDRSNVRWLTLTRKNMADSMALTKVTSPGVLIVDTLNPTSADNECFDNPKPSDTPIRVSMCGLEISIPTGALRPDIQNVLQAVKSL